MILSIVKNKTVLIVLLVILLLTIVFFTGKAKGKNKNFDPSNYDYQPQGNSKSPWGAGGPSGSGVPYNPNSDIRRLYTAMKGWATDEDVIYDVVEGKPKYQLEAILVGFQKLYGKSLFKWFEDDLSGSELKRAMAPFKAQGLAQFDLLTNKHEEMTALEQLLAQLEKDGVPEVQTEITINSAKLNELLIKLFIFIVAVTAAIVLIIKLSR